MVGDTPRRLDGKIDLIGLSRTKLIVTNPTQVARFDSVFHRTMPRVARVLAIPRRKFGPEYTRKLRRRQGRVADVRHLDEVFVKVWVSDTTSGGPSTGRAT